MRAAGRRHATELLDLTGRWCKERSPQRHPWVQGTHRRDARHGRTGHDATLLLVAGTPGFAFGAGEVWAVHTAWSGNHTTYAERTPEGDCLLGGGELLAPGEVVLAPGEAYRSPTLLGSWSPAGLDPLSHRFHAHLRAVTPLARSERPVIANSWEAVYFDHSLERLTELVDVAATVGVERFVLDDGWFLGRRDDTAGLGDWAVDAAVWPEGLRPLVDHVTAAGLQFGLWVEPEMVNLDSETARAHPERVLRGRAADPLSWRHQQVLDLQDEEAYADLRDALLALLDELDVAYLKWDHNRDLTDATHDGRPAVHGQTLAAYRLLDELRAAHPGLEIESCASGGARVDAEVLRRTDRIWASDTIDPLERQHLQRWTSLLVPPELIGSHVGGPTAHTTGRTHALRYRAATALLHWFGIEWDMSRLDAAGLAELAQWVDLHKRVRPLIGSGTLVHPDHPDPGVLVTGVVGADRSEACYVVASVASPATQHPAPLRLTGLDPDTTYRLVEEMAPPHAAGDLSEGWSAVGTTLPGRVLATAGIALPVLRPRRPGAAGGRGLGWPHGRPRLGREVRRERAGLVARAQPLRRRGARRPGAGRRGRPRRRRGPQRDLARRAGLVGDHRRLLAGRPRQGTPARRRPRTRLGPRRRHHLAAGPAGRPGRRRVPPAGRRPAPARGPQRGADAAPRRHPAARRARHDEPHRGDRRTAGPGGPDERRGRARRPRGDRGRGGAAGRVAREVTAASGHHERAGDAARTAWDCLVRVVRR